MAETQDEFDMVYDLHLCSPVAYVPRTPTMGDLISRIEAGCLLIKNGMSPGNRALIKCFPLTPLELHEGWVKGQERIVTARSGKFGWPGSFRARIWHFNEEGKALNESPAQIESSDEVDVEVPVDGLSILERTE